MKTNLFDLKGNQTGDIDLPLLFNFPYRPEIIKKAFVNLYSHRFQKQGRYPAAGEIVSAESRNTGLGIARLARAKGEGFSRAGQAAAATVAQHGRSHRALHPRRIDLGMGRHSRGRDGA